MTTHLGSYSFVRSALHPKITARLDVLYFTEINFAVVPAMYQPKDQ